MVLPVNQHNARQYGVWKYSDCIQRKICIYSYRRIFYGHTSFNLVFRSADRNEPITNAEDRCLFHVYANKARSSKRVIRSKHVQRLPKYACDAQKMWLVL